MTQTRSPHTAARLRPTIPGPCLSEKQIAVCVSHLLLGIYERAPASLRRHVAACLRCRKGVVRAFASRLRVLLPSAAGRTRAGPLAN